MEDEAEAVAEETDSSARTCLYQEDLFITFNKDSTSNNADSVFMCSVPPNYMFMQLAA